MSLSRQINNARIKNSTGLLYCCNETILFYFREYFAVSANADDRMDGNGTMADEK